METIHCKSCGADYTPDEGGFDEQEELWEATRKESGDTTLCLSCWLEKREHEHTAAVKRTLENHWDKINSSELIDRILEQIVIIEQCIIEMETELGPRNANTGWDVDDGIAYDINCAEANILYKMVGLPEPYHVVI